MGASGSRPTVGWRILKIMPNSPCSQKGLVAYFDVLTHVNGVPLGTTEDQLVDLIKDGVETKLTIYHYVTDSVREVTVTPRRGWGGDGLLGLIIRYAHFDNADQDTIHVLEVHPNSPAAKAGLISHQDYLLGTSKLTFKGYDQLDYFLTQYNDKPGELFVFNAEQYQVREVIITPSTNWGGKGSLGCDVGAGYLHRLPLDTTRAVTQLGEGAMTPFISAGTAQQHGHAHAHAHAHAAHGDHGHSHGENDHGHSHGGNDCGHAHGPHDDHGHAHGPHDDHGQAHGVHDDHGHAHGDHGHSHGGNDHGHAHGDHGHSHGGNDHGHAHHGHAPAPVATPSTISYATPTQPTGVTTGAPGQYPPPPQQQQQQQPAQAQAQAQAQYQPQAQYSFAPPPNSFAGQPISSYSDSTTPGLFTQEVYGNQVTDPRLQAAFAGQPQYAAGQYVPATTTPAAAAAAGATPAPAPTTAAGLSVQAPFNTQYSPQQFAGASSYPAHPHPAYLQQAPNQQPYIIQPANVPPMQSQVKLEPSASSLP